ncbi:MAG: DNA primase [Phycisphaerae bacterium]
MIPADRRYGFRIVGACWGARRLIDWAAALRGYAECQPQAECERESYLSAFTFGPDFQAHLDATGSVGGFLGVCWSPWLWLDVDCPGDLQEATRAARKLAVAIATRYRMDDDDLLVFYSGSKGYHIGIPTAAWTPEPSPVFHRIAGRFATQLAKTAGVGIDTGVYDKVRPFRAPNSRHPKTGLHKRRLSVEELMHLPTDAILKLAERPAEFDIPEPTYQSQQAVADWQAVLEHVKAEGAAKRRPRAANGDGASLNRQTLEFIRDGAPVGNRALRLYSAAANLAEFGCPAPLAHALLTEAALDSGLPPKEVRRQIDCGLASASREGGKS